jgi:ADP-ribose pyrophosphatase YjhB (NUDIX family)
MGFPDIGSIYIPPPLAVVELNFADQWRARWVDEQILPKGVPVVYAYSLVFMGDRGYATRRVGDSVWSTVEGDMAPGEKPEAFIRRAAREQTGAIAARLELIGFFECKATSHNTEYPKDAVTVRPVYVVVAKQVRDVPEGTGYERRRLPLNEFMATIRARYPELGDYFGKAIERFAIMRARGEA